MVDRSRALRWLLWFVALSHLLIGGAAFLSRDLQVWVAANFYGAQVTLTDQMSYLAAMTGAFMVGLGVAGIAAARDPVRYRGVVFGFATVLLLRVVQRLVQLGHIEEIFGIEAGRSVMNAAFFGALAVALVVLVQGASRGGRTPGAV